jgi:hypothetical protein
MSRERLLNRAEVCGLAVKILPLIRYHTYCISTQRERYHTWLVQVIRPLNDRSLSKEILDVDTGTEKGFEL